MTKHGQFSTRGTKNAKQLCKVQMQGTKNA